MSAMWQWHQRVFKKGDDVYGSDGKKIGSVQDCHKTYCETDSGFMGMGNNYFIPVNAFRDVDSDSGNIYLDVPGEGIEDMGWDQPPAEKKEVQKTERPMASAPRPDIEAAKGEVHTVSLEREELTPHTHRRKKGEVVVDKDVVEETQTIDVPVSHEEAIVRTRYVDRPADHPIGGEETIRIPLEEEEVTVSKEARVYEEIDIEERKVTEPKKVSGTVRKEVADVKGASKVEEEREKYEHREKK